MDINERNNKIVAYIDSIVNNLVAQYPNMNFAPVRDNAVNAFCSMNGSFEQLVPQINVSFDTMVKTMQTQMLAQQQVQQMQPVNREPFKMSAQEMEVYAQLKKESLDKKEAMGLNDSKKLVLEKKEDNSGFISFFGILTFVVIVVTVLIVGTCFLIF